MIFEGYQNLRIYNSQSKFTLPKSSPDGLQGKGNLVFLMTPNIEKTVNFLIYFCHIIGIIYANHLSCHVNTSNFYLNKNISYKRTNVKVDITSFKW